MPTFHAQFKLEKETKGTFRYEEVDEQGTPETAWGKIGTLYVKKTAFERGTEAPTSLRVTVEY